MEKEIKQRLLGGLVLVAGAALFLPVLLDGSGASLTVPPMPAPPQVAGVDEIAPPLDEKVAGASEAVAEAHAGREEAAAATAAPEAPEAAGEVPPDAAAAAAAEPVTAAPAAATADAARQAAERLATEKAAQQKAAQQKAAQEKAAANARAAASKPAAATAERKPPVTAVTPPAAWVVQVGVFSGRGKAEDLVKKLRGKGYPAVIAAQGAMWKVMVGPELSRQVADSTKAKLAADPELKLNGWVQSYKP